MSYDFMALVALCFAPLGYVGASLSTALGVGSSVLFVPLLLWLLPYLGVDGSPLAVTAIGTSLSASWVVMLVGSMAHWRAGNLDPASREARGLAIAAGCGGILGGTIIASTAGPDLLALVAGGQALVAAALALRVFGIGKGHTHEPAPCVPLQDGVSRAYMLLVGLLTTVGAGGVFLVPYFLYRGRSRSQAAALACFVGVAISTAASILFIGTKALAVGGASVVVVPIGAALALGAFFGGRQGVKLASSIHPAAWTSLLILALAASACRSISLA